MLHYSVSHETAVGYLQFAIPKGIGAGKMKLRSDDWRRNTDLSVPNRLFYFEDICYRGMCHFSDVFINTMSTFVLIAFKSW